MKNIKKVKKILSLALVLAILACSCVIAYAYEPTEVNDYLTLSRKVDSFEYDLYYYLQLTPSSFPHYSETSHQRIKDIVDEIRTEMYSYETPEEFQEASDRLDEVEAGLCIGSYDVKILLDYLKTDVESEGYYDEDTMSELKDVYSSAQTAYDSGDEEAIHSAYMDLRNEFNKLCLYNNVSGDTDGDGIFTVRDITYMQLNIAELVPALTTSQKFVSNLCHYSTIKDITEWQLDLAGLYDNKQIKAVEFNYKEVEALKKLTPDMRHYRFIENESENWFYTQEFYVYWM
ncbi:MAG: hypothetical protein J1E56_03715 [Ruminococcus sp.]|nr:hypothetical protein [Ruminococcus sp.]